VLVTGATGFTGGHLARGLLAAGHDVTALVRPQSAVGAAAHALEEIGVRIAVGDLADRSAVARAAKGVEVVYHIAATYREPGLPDSAYRVVNVEGTRHVLEAALTTGARRVVHCSTGGVHGPIARPPADEDPPRRPPAGEGGGRGGRGG
jgi:nucleoside-diphosphate-sugar epimerase